MNQTLVVYKLALCHLVHCGHPCVSKFSMVHVYFGTLLSVWIMTIHFSLIYIQLNDVDVST